MPVARLPLDIRHLRYRYTKGILGDCYYLAGSMNFTYNGIIVNEEALTYL